MKNIQKLSQTTSRLLSSSNIITSVFSAVKELVENSIDGGSTSIEVKLENYGLERIEVKDNGCGIEQCDVSCVAKAHCTSKLTSHLDLDQLETYGFRGEALSALCSMASLSITTKTVNDDISQTYSFNKTGDVTASKPSPSPCGTVVAAENLFKDIPVRKKYYKPEKCKKEELKKIEDALCAYSCVQIGTRFALYHNKSLVWQKSSATNMKTVLIQVFGNSVVRNLEHKTFESEAEEIRINAYLPKILAPILSVTRAQCDRCIMIINKRPITIKAFHKLIQETYYKSINHNDTRSRFPIYLVDITVPPSKLDVNVDPNKTRVLLRDFEIFLSTLSQFLQTCFSKSETINLANLAVTNGNSKTQLSLPSISEAEVHSKAILSGANLNPPTETVGDKSRCYGAHEPGIFPGDTPSSSLSKSCTNTIYLEAKKQTDHCNMSNLTGINSLTYSLVNQVMSKPATKLQNSDDTSTLQNGHALDTCTSRSKASFLKEASVINGMENCKAQDDCFIIDHINLIRKDNEDVEGRPWTGGLFTHSVSSKELDISSPKLQTILSVNGEAGTLKCQIIDGILPKKTGKHPNVNSLADAIESVSTNTSKDGKQQFLSKDHGINRVEPLFSLESHHASRKTSSEQNKRGSLSLNKNVDSMLNSCRKYSLNSNNNDTVPNFPQLKALFSEPVISKASDIRPHQPVPNISNLNNIKIGEGNIGNKVSSYEPPKAAINSCEPPRSANSCEPTTLANSCEPPRSANFCEPPRSASSCEPSRSASSCESNENQKPGLQTFRTNWSLGKVLDNTGKILQPVSILVPSPTKRSRVESDVSPEGSRKKKLSLTKRKTEAELPKDPSSGFEYFCRSTRLAVQADHPEFSKTEIANVLYQQWNNLILEKKIIFKELAVKQYRKIVKPKKQLGNTLSQALSKSKKSTEEPNDVPDSQSRYKKKEKEEKLNFVLEDLKTLFSMSAENMSKDENLRKLACTPIKVLSPGIWLCLREENLVVLNSYRIKETLIYHRLLNTYQVKPDVLETPINLKLELIIDPECWQVLMTMYSENANALNHVSLTQNGFNLRAIKNDVELSFEAVGIATCVPSYGIHDLQEILRIINTNGLSLSLAKYRPTKVKSYLQNEAFRIGRQSLAVQRHDEMTDLLKQSQKYLPVDTSECFHRKPFQQYIFNISDLSI